VPLKFHIRITVFAMMVATISSCDHILDVLSADVRRKAISAWG
jgi:hypothetical protein